MLSIARLRCPKCREGRAFRSLLAMHDACPVCGHVFEREPGYFVGAMYVSYALAIPVYLAVTVVLGRLLRGWSDPAILALALLLFLPCAPILFRYSRVIWMHLDLAIDRRTRAAPPITAAAAPAARTLSLRSLRARGRSSRSSPSPSDR